jgi:hypothetical protein
MENKKNMSTDEVFAEIERQDKQASEDHSNQKKCFWCSGTGWVYGGIPCACQD